MCGIFGFSGVLNPSVLDKMLERQSHRGPDSGDVLYDSSLKVGLGHNRLSIIDLSEAGKQPMCSADSDYVLIFNGEIYNFKELKEDLLSKGYKFKSDTDSEVILNLYIEKGRGLLNDLRGMFAFALLDKKKNELFIARDHFGIKPLYYSFYDNNFVFASEIKTLLEDQNIPRDINLEAISDHLTYLWCPFPKTILKHVHKLEPGNALIIKGGEIKEKWEFYDINYTGEYDKISEEQAIDQLDGLLEDSIKEQLMSDVPLGAFLSGGLDSSLICAYMRKLNPNKPITAYTISIGEGDMEGNPNDLPYAKQVAEYFNIDLREINVSPEELLKGVEDLAYILDEPLADPAALNVKLISELARKEGCLVLLSGAGGDDVFSGYRRHQAVIIDEKLFKLPGFIRGAFRVVESLVPGQSPKVRRLKKFLYKIDKSRSERTLGLFHWVRDKDKEALFSKSAKKVLGNYKSSTGLLNYLKRISKEKSELNKCLYIDGKFFLTDHNLNYTDKMCMHHSIEGRVPYMDYRMVDWATKLDPSLKLKNGEAKYILKKVGERYLPHDVIYRPKTGFGAPIRKWVDQDLNPLYKKYFTKEIFDKYGVFDRDQVFKMLENNRKGKIDAAYTIFGVLCINIWLEKFLNNEA